MIGDQLFTDVVCGNAFKFYTIKVEPLTTNEGIWTRMIRFFWTNSFERDKGKANT